MDRTRELAVDLVRVQTALDRRHLRRALPLLASVSVASPCDQKWSAMALGADDRTRHCAACKADVYDISAMTADEAEEFLRLHVGADVCIRLFRRADGTLLTRQDCSVGQGRRRRRVAAAVALAGTVAAMAAIAGSAEPQECTTQRSHPTRFKRVEVLPEPVEALPDLGPRAPTMGRMRRPP